MSKVIHEFNRNSTEKVRFSLNSFKGHEYADLRIFYETDEGEWRPTKKGLTVSIELVEELYEGIRKLRMTCFPLAEAK